MVIFDVMSAYKLYYDGHYMASYDRLAIDEIVQPMTDNKYTIMLCDDEQAAVFTSSVVGYYQINNYIHFCMGYTKCMIECPPPPYLYNNSDLFSYSHI